MLTERQLSKAIQSDDIQTVLLVFADHYGRLMGKRVDGDFYLKHAQKSGVEACNYLFTVDMEMNPMPGFEFANWQQGYGDVHLQPDMSTARLASWSDKTAIILCDVLSVADHQPVAIAPRSMLKKQLQRLHEQGYTSFAASELEYYLFDDSYRAAHDKNYQELQASGWYVEDYHILQGSREEEFNAQARQHLKKSGIPVETSKGEWGCGQTELNLEYAEPLEMADRHVLFKQCLKELAEHQQRSVTFMAKAFSDQAGSSSHVHISLYKKGKNAFVGDHDINGFRCSDTFLYFLGGLIHYLPQVMVFYAPTINSYKRYQDASWAPTRLAWSVDNRTAGFRIVGHDQNLRIECRIPGADINPYLTYSAMLASGLAGIEQQIKAPDMFTGDVYAAESLPEVPKSLDQAVQLFAHSDFAKQAFGEDVVAHYEHFYRLECQAYQKAVTDWERQRYFEQI